MSWIYVKCNMRFIWGDALRWWAFSKPHSTGVRRKKPCQLQVLRLFCSYCAPEKCFLVWDQCVLDEDRARLGQIVRSAGIDSNMGFKKLTSDAAVLSNGCRANDCMCCQQKGGNSFSFKKSYTDIPNNSETKQMWLRWSNQCNRCMHLIKQLIDSRISYVKCGTTLAEYPTLDGNIGAHCQNTIDRSSSSPAGLEHLASANFPQSPVRQNCRVAFVWKKIQG
jgi:hypothetical protein